MTFNALTNKDEQYFMNNNTVMKQSYILVQLDNFLTVLTQRLSSMQKDSLALNPA